jgi:hypothetical protein
MRSSIPISPAAQGSAAFCCRLNYVEILLAKPPAHDPDQSIRKCVRSPTNPNVCLRHDKSNLRNGYLGQ